MAGNAAEPCEPGASREPARRLSSAAGKGARPVEREPLTRVAAPPSARARARNGRQRP